MLALLALGAAPLPGSPALSHVPSSATPSPAHARAFAPPGDERFEFFVTPESIDAVARFYRDRSPARAHGSWEIARGAATDAFDGAALFDRSRLARLYGGRHPRIARGPVSSEGREYVVLLMSPYPSADSSAVHEGTLIMAVWLKS